MPDSVSPVVVVLLVVATIAAGVGTLLLARTGSRVESSPSPSSTPSHDPDPNPTRMSVPHPDTPPPVSDDPTRVPAGWYPVLGGGKRYWDGERWTDHHAA